MDKFTLAHLTVTGLCIAARAATTATERAAIVTALHARLEAQGNRTTESERAAIRDTVENLGFA